jgi:hypothetical protein
LFVIIDPLRWMPACDAKTAKCRDFAARQHDLLSLSISPAPSVAHPEQAFKHGRKA